MSSTFNSPDVVTISGYLNSAFVGSLTLNGANTTFSTFASPFSGQLIDELRVTVTERPESSSGRIMDNFVFTVPEPASATLLVAALSGLALRHRWQRL